MQPTSGELPEMNNLNPLVSLHNSHFDPTSSTDDFLDQMFSSVPSSASSFSWPDDHAPPPPCHHLEDQSTALLASKLRQQQISNGAAKALLLQHQLMLSRGLAVNDLRSPSGADIGFLNIPLADQEEVVDGSCYKSANPDHESSIKALFNGFTGSISHSSNQPQNLLHSQSPGALQSQKFSGAAAAAEMNQPAASGTSGGGTAGQPKQRVRARRGQATDPHSIAERLRRERIAERMKSLQELVPNGNKTDKASMLDEIIDYVKFLQLQVKVLSMSRLGGAGGGGAAANPLVADISSEGGRNGNGTQTASSSNNDGMTVTEHQVAKLMEEDMGSAMQYLQGKGLCLMPISLATAISTATCHTRSHHPSASNNPLLNGDAAAGPTSPSMSALTVQSATIAANGGGETSLKDTNSVSKP